MYTHIVVNLYNDSHVHRCILVCYPYMYIDVGVNLWSNLIRVEVWSILWKKEDSRGPKVQKKWYFSIDVVDHTSCHISLTTTESGLRRSRDTTTKAENMIWRWRWRGLETWRSRCWRDTTKSNDHWWTRPHIDGISDGGTAHGEEETKTPWLKLQSVSAIDTIRNIAWHISKGRYNNIYNNWLNFSWKKNLKKQI